MTMPPTSADPAAAPVLRRIGWLHFANDATLDFLTPLLPAGVPVAWIGVMEGLADGIGQVLKLVTGRASDRSGRRAAWVATGYLVNAWARPLTAVGMCFFWPLWIVGCRIIDRVGKGLRGSATDALVADWSAGPDRAAAFAWMRTMDHLGATVGGLAAALAAWWLPPERLWMAVAGLAVVAAWVAWLSRGLRDRAADAAAAPAAAPAGWWPRSPELRRPLLAIAVASIAAKLSPLLILVHVAGVEDPSRAWPLWLMCLGWAGFGLIQAMASGVAGMIAKRLGNLVVLRAGWAFGAVGCVGLALVSGPLLLVVGVAFAILAGLTEGAEKAWLADHAPKSERAIAFGALALVTAAAGLIGNGVVGLLLATVGPIGFLGLAGAGLLGVVLTWAAPARN
ncbi:MFS transporter [Planctomycetota bacterium]|nr:MFS transporter [Planctomycetota bacterium]